MSGTWRPHALLSGLYLLSRAALFVAGLRFSFSLDWMWLSDPADLRARLGETLWYFHAFPPGMNALTGALLAAGGDATVPVLAQALFWGLGVVFVNALFALFRAVGLSTPASLAVALACSLTPPTIYFEHLYLYEWPVTTLLCAAAVLFYRAVRRPSAGAWLACFAVCAAIAVTRSSFHLTWLVVIVAGGVWLSAREARRAVLRAAVIPIALVTALYGKNLLLFGEFAASTFGPASLTLVTVAHLPPDVRDLWMRDEKLSPFAATSVYAPPREYARFFATPAHEAFPAQVTRLDHATVDAANFNHWWLLEVHRARRADVMTYLRERPLAYVANAARGLRDLFGPSTAWHPRDRAPIAPHHQHREVLGRYEAWFNAFVHTWPVAPVGIYLFLPVPLVWAAARSWRLLRSADPAAHARGALLIFCLFQIVYVVAASSMLTSLESARYRFQIEWAIWVILAACIARSRLITK